jgi:hypothetical protein
MPTRDITDQQVCEAVREWSLAGSRFADEILAERTGQPLKVCVRAMERADRHGLLEWGVSLRSGWLTQRGHDLLQETAKAE